ncbi:MAG: SDR family NAD(P)-dependent oxidoreductase [Planctomycetota bacterium]
MPSLTGWLRRPREPDADAPGDLAHLLDRPPIKLDTPEAQRLLGGRRVLVTGAGGSIGSELCRQIARFCPRRLVILDQSEFGLFTIRRELSARWLGLDLRAAIADVCDERRISDVLAQERPHVLFHAAAHKHVGLMEDNPGEAVKVNVLGTHHVAHAAARLGVGTFVFISTDKAVNPSSVMGATKRAAEQVIAGIAKDAANTRFCCVRFGNVLGSSGSVVPIFEKQIDEGGPVTVTHPEMRRFLMTIPEAAGLVLQAGATAEGGEIFVLEMGEQVRILDLANALIRRRGLEPGKDIAIRFTGVGAGEKLEEELADARHPTRATRHPKICIWLLPEPTGAAADPVRQLRPHLDDRPADVRSALGRVVEEYRPTGHDQPVQPLRLAA